GIHANLVDGQEAIQLVEDVDCAIFSVHRWHRADAEVEAATRGTGEQPAAVERTATFGNIHSRHGLDVRDATPSEVQVQASQRAHHAQMTAVNLDLVLVGIEVQVADVQPRRMLD